MPESDPNRPDANNRLGRVSKNAAFLMMLVLQCCLEQVLVNLEKDLLEFAILLIRMK